MLFIQKQATTTTTMKFSVIAVTALAAATSSSCFVSATAAAASRKRKMTKKVTNRLNGAAGPPTPDGIPIGGIYVPADDRTRLPLVWNREYLFVKRVFTSLSGTAFSDNFALYYRRSRISRTDPVFSVFSVRKLRLQVLLVDRTESLLLQLRPRKLVGSSIGLEKLCFWCHCIKGIVIITNLVPIRKCLLTIILQASFGSWLGFVDSKHVCFIRCICFCNCIVSCIVVIVFYEDEKACFMFACAEII